MRQNYEGSFFLPILINNIINFYRNIVLYYCINSKIGQNCFCWRGGGGWSKSTSSPRSAISAGQIDATFGCYSVQRLVPIFFHIIRSFESFMAAVVPQVITVLWSSKYLEILLNEKWYNNNNFLSKQLTFNANWCE